MGRVRARDAKTQDSPKASAELSLEEEVAWLIGGILLGTIIVPNPTLAIAEALVNLVPSFLPPTLRADISASVARLVLTGTPKGSGALSAANRENLKYRVAYGFEAIKRLVKAVRGPGDEIEARLAKALKREQGYFKAHRVAQAKRTEQDAMIQTAIKTHGNVLSWHSVERPTSRPHHLAADKHNWDASQGPPRATGALPGVLPHCICTFGPPIPGAKVIS